MQTERRRELSVLRMKVKVTLSAIQNCLTESYYWEQIRFFFGVHNEQEAIDASCQKRYSRKILWKKIHHNDDKYRNRLSIHTSPSLGVSQTQELSFYKGGWTRWPPEIPYKLLNSVIQQHVSDVSPDILYEKYFFFPPCTILAPYYYSLFFLHSEAHLSFTFLFLQ